MGAVLLTLAGAVAAMHAAASSPEPLRKAELIRLLRHDCGSCHGLTLKGGLGPPLLPATLAGKPDDVLVATILHGRPGTPMPPWSFALSEEDAAWLVAVMRQGAP